MPLTRLRHWPGGTRAISHRLLALLNREAGHEQVLAVLPTAVIGTVNLTEVLSKRGVRADAATEAVYCVGVDIVPHALEHALLAGALRPTTKAFGLSLGDRACLAPGRAGGAAVITAERHWDERVEAVAGVSSRRIRAAG